MLTIDIVSTPDSDNKGAGYLSGKNDKGDNGLNEKIVFMHRGPAKRLCLAGNGFNYYSYAE